jgi:thiamine kinase-like enzyme
MRWILFFFVCFLHAEDPLDAARELLCSSLPEDTQFTSLSGLTNKNYLFTAEGKKYVIRLPGEGTERFIDRSAECVNSKEAYFQGFSPTHAIFFDPATGRQLTPFIDGFKGYEFEGFYQDDLVEQIAHLLSQIHTSSLAFKNHIDFFERMDRLGLYLQEQAISLPPEYLSLRVALQEHLHLDCFEPVPSHGDPVPSNFALLDGKLMLFDWEYSGLIDPACDLAFLSSVMSYSKEQEEDLLRYYGATPMSLLREKLIYFKPIVESWLGLWGILQTVCCNESQKEFFKTFSIVRFKRAERVLHSEEYGRAIELLTPFHKKDGRLFRTFPIDPQVPLLAVFPRLSDRVGLTQIEFGLWICPYCGILNPMAKRGCVCPSCPLK